VNRLHLSRSASEDLDEIRRYLDTIPRRYAQPIAKAIRALLEEVAAHPDRGSSYSAATLVLHQEIKSRALPPYRIFYRVQDQIPEVVAVVHMARDVESILAKRLQ
jgi:plasmid stabilization system protein ParE